MTVSESDRLAEAGIGPDDQDRDAALAGTRAHSGLMLALLAVGVVAIGILSISVGRYSVPFGQVLDIMISSVVPIHHSWSVTDQDVVLQVRLPQTLLTMLVGGGLAVSGAVLQAVLRNPVADPQILGVSSGASFGGALIILLGLGSAALVSAAFGFGLLALVVVFVAGRSTGSGPTLTIVLAGVVTAAFFTALVSFLTYLANPETQLQSIVFWLLGSFSTATYSDDLIAGIPVLVGVAVILSLRWRVNVLSLGDEDARALGVNPQMLRWYLLVSVAVITSASVAVSGVIGWVGLVIPHLARPWTGADHRRLLPASALLGAGYLTIINTLCSSILPWEIPVGVLTAVVGAPVFFVLLRRGRNRTWVDA